MASGKLAGQAGPATGDLPGSRPRSQRAVAALAQPAAAGRVVGSRGAEGADRRGAARRALRAAGRRLRRELRRTANPTRSPSKLKILLQMSLVLVHGLQEAGRARRAHRRPVREAALGRHRDARRRDAAELSRRHRQSPGIHAPRIATPDPQLPAARLRARGADAELRALADRRRLRRPASPGVLGPRLRAALAADGRVRAHRAVDLATRSTSSRRSARSADSRSRAASTSTRATKALHLQYEQAQTRFIERQRRWYNLSTHMPWIGMRTAALDGAHVEFFRGISNPVGDQGRPVDERRVGAGPARDAQSATTSRAASC